MDFAIMHQTTDGRKQETVCLVIMDTVSSLVRWIPCVNVLPHVLETTASWGVTPKDINCDNAQEFIHEHKFKSWHQDNQISLVRVQSHRHLIQGKIENFIRHLKGKIRAVKFLKGIPNRFWSDLTRMYHHNCKVNERTLPSGKASVLNCLTFL